MKDWQRVQQYVIGAPSPGFSQGPRIASEVSVGDSCSLGLPRRSGGVEHRGLVGGLARSDFEIGLQASACFRQGAVARAAKGEQVFHGGSLDEGCELYLVLGAANEEAWFRVFQIVRDLGRRIGDVQRNVDAAGLQASHVEGDCVRRFIDLHDYPVPGLATCTSQERGKGGAAIYQVAIGVGALPGFAQEWTVEGWCEPGLQDFKYVFAHWGRGFLQRALARLARIR